MYTLEEQLADLIKRRGPNAASIPFLRAQIAAQKSGKTFEQMFVTGSVSRQDSETPTK
jgi:hypothetical protein